MPRRKSNLGRRTRRAEAMRQERANQIAEEQASANDQVQRQAQIHAEAAAERRGVTLQQHKAGLIVSTVLLEDSKTLSSIKTEHPEVDLEYPDADSSAKETLTKGQIFDEMDIEMPAVVKAEQPEVYLDYAEIPQSPQSYPFITTQEHSKTELYHATDFRFVKQELSDALCKDRTQRFNKTADIAGNSSTETAKTEKDYKELFNLENCNQISENEFSVIDVNKNPYLNNENSQLCNMETVVDHTQISRGLRDFTIDSASSMCPNKQTACLSDGFNLSDNVEKERQNVEKPDKQQVYNVAVTKADHVIRANKEEKLHNRDKSITSFMPRSSVHGQQIKHTGDKPYKCGVCGYYFARSKHLVYHKRQHRGEKRYKCDVCHASYARAILLKCHKRTHKREKPYLCDVCDAFFATAGILKCHKRTHTGEKPYLCDVCGASFSQKVSLMCHMRTHTGEKPYKCDVCGATFAQNGSLKSHKRTHTGEKPYKCAFCGATFSQNNSLKTHVRTHTGDNPYKCHICEASFNLTSALKQHKRTHTGEKRFKCDVCESYFSTVDSLIYHKRTHTAEKPYNCAFCGASFATVGILKCHKRICTGKKPYKCDVCGAGFAQNDTLICHKRTHTHRRDSVTL